ncbi:sigma factor [Pseudothermotoga sp. U03pept]|uniref:sigma factor n=1 Tax=Pseudothermotoga sp. U03pept TaxID=3447012 RepID=UPI003F05A2A1
MCEELFKQYNPILKSVCKEFWNKHFPKIDSYQDLYQTACYLFIYAYHTWQPEKGNFASHLKRVLSFKLKSMLKGEYAPWHDGKPFTFLKDVVRKSGNCETNLLEDEFFDMYIC